MDESKALAYSASEIDEILGDVGNKITAAQATAAICGEGTAMTKNTSFNSYDTPGVYYAYNAVSQTLTDGPVSIGANHIRLEVVSIGSLLQQRLFISANSYDDKFYIRRRNAIGDWTSWYVHTGAVVT